MEDIGEDSPFETEDYIIEPDYLHDGKYTVSEKRYADDEAMISGDPDDIVQIKRNLTKSALANWMRKNIMEAELDNVRYV